MARSQYKIYRYAKTGLKLGLLALVAFGTASQADTKYEYDQLGRLIKVEYKNDQGTKYFYDAAGNRASTVTDSTSSLPDAPPKSVNMITVPIGGMTVIIF